MTANHFHQRASQRLRSRGHAGGQHRASQGDTTAGELNAVLGWLFDCRPVTPELVPNLEGEYSYGFTDQSVYHETKQIDSTPTMTLAEIVTAAVLQGCRFVYTAREWQVESPDGEVKPTGNWSSLVWLSPDEKDPVENLGFEVLQHSRPLARLLRSECWAGDDEDLD